MSDRIAGAVLAALALWFGITARSFEQGFGDPLGPAVFPQLIAVPMGLLAVFMLLRPAPNAEWPHGRAMLHQGAGLAVLLGYPLLIEPLGFPLSTLVGMGLLVRLLGATWPKAVVSAAITGVALYLLFDRLLGLPLPLVPKLF